MGLIFFHWAQKLRYSTFNFLCIRGATKVLGSWTPLMNTSFLIDFFFKNDFMLKISMMIMWFCIWCQMFLCSSTAQNSEGINGEHLVDVLPVFQVKRSPPLHARVSESAVYCAGGLWRTYLDAHRRTSASEHRSHVSSEASSASSDSDSADLQMRSSRKSSAPAVLTRQMSFGSYRSTPAGSKHQPFPQRKSLRKSETARRLGLYASL